MLAGLPDALRGAQEVFESTGGLHAAGLFDGEGRLLAAREDVGRHNALDKLLGWAFLEGLLPLRDHIVMVSGRSSYEILQKCLVAGVPVVCAVSAPSSLAVELADQLRRHPDRFPARRPLQCLQRHRTHRGQYRDPERRPAAPARAAPYRRVVFSCCAGPRSRLSPERRPGTDGALSGGWELDPLQYPSRASTARASDGLSRPSLNGRRPESL